MQICAGRSERDQDAKTHQLSSTRAVLVKDVGVGQLALRATESVGPQHKERHTRTPDEEVGEHSAGLRGLVLEGLVSVSNGRGVHDGKIKQINKGRKLAEWR